MVALEPWTAAVEVEAVVPVDERGGSVPPAPPFTSRLLHPPSEARRRMKSSLRTQLHNRVHRVGWPPRARRRNATAAASPSFRRQREVAEEAPLGSRTRAPLAGLVSPLVRRSPARRSPHRAPSSADLRRTKRGRERHFAVAAFSQTAATPPSLRLPSCSSSRRRPHPRRRTAVTRPTRAAMPRRARAGRRSAISCRRARVGSTLGAGLFLERQRGHSRHDL